MNHLFSTLTISSILAGGLVAQDDRENIAPTGWRTRSSATVADIASNVTDGYRMIDIEVRSTSPLLFTANFVRDTGTYDKSWSWYYGKTAAEIGGLINSSRRLIKLTPYVVNGTVLYCAIFVDNTGSNQKQWYWWYGQTLDYIKGRCSVLGARLVDIESHVLNGNRYYCGVAIRNSGSDLRTWQVWDAQSTAGIQSKATTYNMRVYDLERTAAGVYDVIMVRPPVTTRSWFYVGQSMGSLGDLSEQLGARIFDVEYYSVAGTAYYTALLIQNTNELTTEVGADLRQDTDGSTGFILKQINGSTYASLQTGFVFDPASTIKQLHGAFAYRRAAIDANVTEKSSIPYRDGPCPYTTGNLLSETLEDAVLKVLEDSDNRLTDAIEKRFGGKSALHAFADSIGMTDTRSNRVMGCTAPPFNTMTLNDLVDLHTAIAGGLLGQYRMDFLNRMRNAETNFPGIGTRYMSTVISQERSKAALSASEFQMFDTRFMLAYKPGAKTINGKEYRTTSGWAQIPFVVNNSIVTRQFVWGAFAHGASDATKAENGISKAVHELLRDRIAAAMATFKGFELGSFTRFGTACKVGSRTPNHEGSGYPVIGYTANLSLAGGPSFKTSLMWIGVSRTQWGRTMLPLNLGLIGAPGCLLNVSPNFSIGGTTDFQGQLTFKAPIPNSKSLVGMSVYTQFAMLAPGQNAAGFVTSNGLETLIGGTR